MIRDRFRIDIDLTDFNYAVGEIEAIGSAAQDGARIKAELLELAEQLGINSGNIRGKVVEFIRITNLRQWRLLCERGVIIPEQM